MIAWYTVSPTPWSIITYALWAWWASKKISPEGSLRKRLAAWVECVWIAGVVVLVGDILWVSAVWIRWVPTYPDELMLLVYSQIRNFCLLSVSIVMSWHLWEAKIVQWGSTVGKLWGLNLLYLLLWFGLAPGLEWTHWVYSLENGYSCWPYVWGIGYIIGRAITTLIYWRTWNV